MQIMKTVSDIKLEAKQYKILYPEKTHTQYLNHIASLYGFNNFETLINEAKKNNETITFEVEKNSYLAFFYENFLSFPPLALRLFEIFIGRSDQTLFEKGKLHALYAFLDHLSSYTSEKYILEKLNHPNLGLPQRKEVKNMSYKDICEKLIEINSYLIHNVSKKKNFSLSQKIQFKWIVHQIIYYSSFKNEELPESKEVISGTKKSLLETLSNMNFLSEVENEITEDEILHINEEDKLNEKFFKLATKDDIKVGQIFYSKGSASILSEEKKTYRITVEYVHNLEDKYKAFTAAEDGSRYGLGDVLYVRRDADKLEDFEYMFKCLEKSEDFKDFNYFIEKDINKVSEIHLLRKLRLENFFNYSEKVKKLYLKLVCFNFSSDEILSEMLLFLGTDLSKDI